MANVLTVHLYRSLDKTHHERRNLPGNFVYFSILVITKIINICGFDFYGVTYFFYRGHEISKSVEKLLPADC